jgi:hypothetical protein
MGDIIVVLAETSIPTDCYGILFGARMLARPLNHLGTQSL